MKWWNLSQAGFRKRTLRSVLTPTIRRMDWTIALTTILVLILARWISFQMPMIWLVATPVTNVLWLLFGNTSLIIKATYHSFFNKQSWAMKHEVNNILPAEKKRNKKLVKKYTKDPRIYWNQTSNTSSLPSFLIATVMFIFSIFAASANCERGFSKMSYMISSRRAGITADNADKRLTIQSDSSKASTSWSVRRAKDQESAVLWDIISYWVVLSLILPILQSKMFFLTLYMFTVKKSKSLLYSKILEM